MYLNKILAAVCVASIILAVAPISSLAADKAVKSSAKSTKSYGEEEFLKLFSHKSRKQVSDTLGKPVRTGQASKPSGAEETLGRALDSGKGANIEMWYYENKVRYDPKHTYKTVEMAFVNDRCTSITYFNDR
jgi:hypothetical protein